MTDQLLLAEDLEGYEEFINQEYFAGLKLNHYIADVQRIYCADKRPWVIGYSGGKDSSAVMSLVYMALLGLPKDQRQKPVFVVSSDTLVETPVVVNHIKTLLKRSNLALGEMVCQSRLIKSFQRVMIPFG